MAGSGKDSGKDSGNDDKGRGKDLAFGAGAVAAVAGGMAAHEAVTGTPAEAAEDPGFGSGADDGSGVGQAPVDLDDGPVLAETGELGRDASFDLVDDETDLPGLDDQDLPGLDDQQDVDDLVAMGGHADDLDLDDPADADLDDLDFG